MGCILSKKPALVMEPGSHEDLVSLGAPAGTVEQTGASEQATTPDIDERKPSQFIEISPNDRKSVINVVDVESRKTSSATLISSARPSTVQRPSKVQQNGTAYRVLLDIPTRLQWKEDNGYCGETSIQGIALTHGAYFSQYAVRKAGKSELLVGTKTFDRALKHFFLEHEDWGFDEEPQPQYEKYIVWIKQQVARGNPVIFTVYLTDGKNDNDYDHIMTVIGYESNHKEPSKFSNDDVLIFYSHFDPAPIYRKVSDFVGTRQSCAFDSKQGGVIPRDVCYAVAVKGMRHPTRSRKIKVRLTMSSTSEPYIRPKRGHGTPTDIFAKVECSGLVAGCEYTIYRYESQQSYALDPQGRSMYRFTATGSTYIFDDKDPIKSDGVAFYECELTARGS